MLCPVCGNDSHNPAYCDNCGEILDYSAASWWDMECCDVN